MKKVLFLIVALLIFFSASEALAAESVITIRFDDGLMTQYDNARPVLAKYNYPAALYVFTDPLVEGNWDGYMRWEHVRELQNVYGWEIGSHSKSHPFLTNLSDNDLRDEIVGSKSLLFRNGIWANGFVSPFGYYDNRVLATVARFYANHGSAWPLETNTFPYNNYAVSVKEARGTTSVNEVKSWIDQAEEEGKWLVILFHGIVNGIPSTYEYSKDDFEEIIDYINSLDIPVVTPKEALDLPCTNLIINESFELSSFGWNGVKIDRTNQGSYPFSFSSAKIVGGPEVERFYNLNMIKVEPGEPYIFKAYFNCQDFSSGGVDVFFDGYDAQGNWKTWEWKTGIWRAFVGERAVSYVPPEGVKKLHIWFQAAAGSDLTCYLDNIKLIELEGDGIISTMIKKITTIFGR